jgi:hypothetical protein
MLTRSAQEKNMHNGVWPKARNKPWVIVSPHIAPLRMVIERVFGSISACSKWLEGKTFVSQRTLAYEAVLILIGKQNKRIEAGNLKFIRANWDPEIAKKAHRTRKFSNN